MNRLDIVIDLTNNEKKYDDYIEEYENGYKLKSDNKNYICHILGILENENIICALLFENITLNDIAKDFNNIFGKNTYSVSIIKSEEDAQSEEEMQAAQDAALKSFVKDCLLISSKKSGDPPDEKPGYKNYAFIKKVKSEQSILKEAPSKGDYYIIRFKNIFEEHFKNIFEEHIDKAFFYYMLVANVSKLLYYGTAQPFTRIDIIKEFVVEVILKVFRNFRKRSSRKFHIKNILKKSSMD